MTLNRREFVQLAAAIGASLAWGGSARASTAGWHERRDLYPEGASADPDPSSVILWTRRPFESGGRRVLAVEVAEDECRAAGVRFEQSHPMGRSAALSLLRHSVAWAGLPHAS
jgi:phosphodiesterase/alkaline phosphatase D-like protein